MIHQLYYQSIVSPVGFVGLSPGLSDSQAQQWTLHLGYEFPRGCVRAEDAPARYAVVDPTDEHRLVLSTTPVAGSRANKSMTHVLVVPRGQYKLTELLGGYRHSSWVTYLPGSAPEILGRLPWENRQIELDRYLTLWLADASNLALARFVIASHLSLPAGRRMFLAIEPDQVFWAVYAAARLLPRAVADSITFATYQHDPTYRTERVVGTTVPLPSGCGQGGDVAHDATVGMPPLPPPSPPRDYADRILRWWLAPATRPVVDAFLFEASSTQEPRVLDIWLRLKVDAASTSDDELVTLAANPFWADKIAATSDLFFRVICTGSAEIGTLLSRTTESRRRDYLKEVVGRLKAAIATGNAVDTAAWLKRLQGFPVVLATEGRKAVEESTPVTSAEVCRFLLNRLDRLDCQVLATEDRLTRDVINNFGSVPAEKVARWLVFGSRELSVLSWLNAVASDALRPHLLNNVVSHPRGVAIVAKWLSGQSAIQAVTAEIQSVAIKIIRKNRGKEVTEEIVRALIENNAYPQRSWVPDLAAEFRLWGSTSREFRTDLIVYLVADPDGTIAEKNIRAAVLAIETSDIRDRLPPRWIALVRLHNLEVSDDQRTPPDEWAKNLKVLHEWGRAFPDPLKATATDLSAFPAGLIRNLIVSRVALLAPDVLAGERMFREWESAVGMIWKTTKRTFVRDILDGIVSRQSKRADEAAVVRAAIIRWAKTEPEHGESLSAVVAYLRELEAQSPSDLDKARDFAVRDEWRPTLRAVLWPERRPTNVGKTGRGQNDRQQPKKNNADPRHAHNETGNGSEWMENEWWMWILYIIVIAGGISLFMWFFFWFCKPIK